MSWRAAVSASLAGLAVALSVSVAACGRGAGAQGGEPPPPVVGVVEIAHQDFENTLRLSGRVSAFEVSQVRPQIGGIVRSRRFTEGANVRAGQVLYEIDPGPARAEASSAQAAAASARARYERYQRLIAIGAVSQQELDDARAASDQAAAALANARLSVGYTRITAPISGVIGASSVTPGALATPAQAEPFAVIQQIDRVYVDMTQSAGELMSLRRSLGSSKGGRTRVRLILQDGSEYPLDGQLQFSEVTVDESTGTVRLRALFPNPHHLLLPGMFVQGRVSAGVDPNAILAPQEGVSRNARGQAVAMVLNQQNVVEERVLETGQTAGDKWVVRSGLNPGDRLIVEGVQRVQPGAHATAAPITPRPTQEGDSSRARDDLRGREG